MKGAQLPWFGMFARKIWNKCSQAMVLNRTLSLSQHQTRRRELGKSQFKKNTKVLFLSTI